MASSCAVANAVADNLDFMWSAFDDGGGVPIAVALMPVDRRNQDNFECLLILSGKHME